MADKYMDDLCAKWQKAMEAKGHKPVMDMYGRLNYFVLSQGRHNGPGCSTCGWTVCWHCDDNVDHIPQCKV